MLFECLTLALSLPLSRSLPFTLSRVCYICQRHGQTRAIGRVLCEKHVRLKWLECHGIGDHQPESNRCKLNKAKKIRQKCFHFQTFVCVLGTRAYAIMNRIFYLLNEIWPLHRFKLADRIVREKRAHILTLACGGLRWNFPVLLEGSVNTRVT